MTDPYRVIIDLPEVDFQLPAGSGADSLGLVSEYRYGAIGEGKSRIVIDTDGPVLIARSFIEKSQGGDPARIVVDLVKTDEANFTKSAPPSRTVPRCSCSRFSALGRAATRAGSGARQGHRQTASEARQHRSCGGCEKPAAG